MENEYIKAIQARQGSPFLTTKQAACYLGLSVPTLDRMRVESSGPRFRKHGRYVRYHINDLEAWSESQKRETTMGERSKKK